MENDMQKITPCVACGVTHYRFFAKKNNFDLYRCMDCGHVVIYPFSFDTKIIYGGDYFWGADKGSGYVDYDQDKEPMRPVFKKYLRLISQKLTRARGTLLDVGAATGFFMVMARDVGFVAYGVEISEYAAGVGRARGLDIKTGVLSEYPPGKMFDVVTLWDVLEHFPEPKKEIIRAYDLLNSGGILAINTPDSGSLYARLLGRRWHLLVPPEHINYFTRKSVRLLLEKQGFEVLVITTIGKTFTLEYILHILSAWTKWDLFQKMAHYCHTAPLLSRITLPINLFDNMFVLARKI
jgi:2-polyprenyl-3-methyl-5-hydroxy-6-metoxy-1,4-benzoquinol methylase